MDDPISLIGVQLEKDNALKDAETIIKLRGAEITVRLYEESGVTRGKYNTIKKRNSISTPGQTFYAYPIIYNPTEKQLEDAGIRERTEVLIKTAVKTWIDYGYTMETLRVINSIRATVIMDGAKYEIKDKQLDSQYQDTFLYIHLGLNRV
jgi:hypothetical protein